MRQYKDYRAAPVMRTIRLPGSLWDAAKESGQQASKPVRQVLEEACGHMPRVIARLRSIGFRSEWPHDRLIRAPLSPAVLEAMKQGQDQTGLPQAWLLALALHYMLFARELAAEAEVMKSAKPTRRGRRRRAARKT